MKKIMFALSFTTLASSSVFAGDLVKTQSPVFSKGECSVAYQNAEGKTSYEIVKQDSLPKLKQNNRREKPVSRAAKI